MTAYCSSPAVLTLTLGTLNLDLMDQANGFRISEVDLGFPDVREDSDLRTSQHGALDYTRLFGARAVTINGSIVPSAAGSRQKALHALVPFLDPGARPVLTYQIDGDVTARTLTLRPASLSVPFNNPGVSAFQLGFKAPDPVAYDSVIHTDIAYSNRGQGGRAYNLVPNRVYPPSTSSSGINVNNGDMTVYPLLRIYGPASNITLTENIYFATIIQTITLSFKTSFLINAGDRVDLDCKNRTALLNGDPANSVYSQIGWNTQGAWPYMPPGNQTRWLFGADGVATSTQMQIVWQDGYLL